MDDAIGQLLDLLDQLGVADNTLVIFFSDNGGGGSSDNTPLRGGKGQMFEGGIRVPCIARYPGRIPAGSVRSAFTGVGQWTPPHRVAHFAISDGERGPSGPW